MSASRLAGRADHARERRVFTRRGRRGWRRCGPRRTSRFVSTSDVTGIAAMRLARSIVSGSSASGSTARSARPARDRVVGGDPLAGVELDRGPLVAHHRPASAGCPRPRARRRAGRTARAGVRAVAMSTRSHVQQHRSCRCRRRAVDRGDHRLLERGDGVEEVRESRARRRRSRAGGGRIDAGPSRRGPGRRRTRVRCR